jgi:type VI secretion system Hcp family effector
MAENAHLTLKIAGAEAKGSSTQVTDGSIECYSVSFGVTNPIDWATGSASGRREYSAIAITKRTDKVSPLLMKALTGNQVVEGSIKFFRPPHDGSDKSEPYYTIEFKFGRIESFQMSSGGGDIPMESVTFAYRQITHTYDSKDAKGVTFTDDWSKGK